MSSDRIEALMNQAEALMQARRYEEAIAIFQQALAIAPRSIEVLRQYGKALAQTNQDKKTFEIFKKALKIAPDDVDLLRNYGATLSQKKQHEKAIKILKKALRIRPNDVKVLSGYSNALKQAGRLNESCKIFDRLLEIEPENIITLNSYARCLITLGEIEKACNLFENSLQIQPTNSRTLDQYAGVLTLIGQDEKALQLFERSLENQPDDAITLSRYASSLVLARQHEKALQFFERSLKIQPNNAITLSRYANTLAFTRQHEKALQFFECSLEIQPNDAMTLSRYANALASTEQHEKALQFFERSLETQPTHDVVTLTNYARSLFKTGNSHKALKIFEDALHLKPDDAITLSSYGKVLSDLGDCRKAIRIFERSLKLQNNNIITLTFYAETLTKLEFYDDAFRIFERCLRINLNDVITLSSYINALLKTNRYKRAVELSEILLSIEPNNITNLIRYGRALIGAGLDVQGLEVFQRLVLLEPNNAYILGQYAILLTNLGDCEKACRVFSHCLQIRPDSYLSFQYARALEAISKHQEAIDQLESINLDGLTSYQANVIRVSLGRLYYRMKQLEKGNENFESAIVHSDDKERTLLYSARSILASNPYSETAVEMLQQIAEDSPRYAQALEMLTLNLNEEDYFEMVKTNTQSGLNDTEMLNRAMYHKIANEISILKGIAYRILRRSEREDPLLSDIIQDIEDVFSEVDRRRVAQKSEIETISHNDYDSVLAVISKTAHDISDFVNNQLAVIESKTRRAMQKLQPADTHYAQFKKLLTQLELTQAALNDLKAINEGIRIKYSRFKVRKLFEKWESELQIAQAQIVLDIQNGSSEFNGDEEKIKSALNELVENSLKHNSSQQNLTIRITSQDVMNPPGIWGRTIPGEQKYLFIEFLDNGKGVAADKKDWIFQPLKTTSQEDKGSGLGLFIIRKTLTKMNGYIRETGINGARFEIYIPYSTVES